YDSLGRKMSTYNSTRLGSLQFVDATNPLKLVLSYPDFGNVVMLDNTLSEVGTVNLKLIGILNYKTICFSSRDNNFWVYDEDDYKLKKVDRNGNIILESTDMLLQLGDVIHPVYMQEQNQYLFVSDTSKGLLVFDLYGVYYETLPFKNVKKFQVNDDRIYFLQGDHLHMYQMKSLDEKDIVLPGNETIIDTRLGNNRLYLLSADSLLIYRY
ncbi:MAG: hypothetical protein ACHQD9_08655, partial [Chitinophagales bacterium]